MGMNVPFGVVQGAVPQADEQGDSGGGVKPCGPRNVITLRS